LPARRKPAPSRTPVMSVAFPSALSPSGNCTVPIATLLSPKVSTANASQSRTYRSHARLYLMERIAAIGAVRQPIYHGQYLQDLGLCWTLNVSHIAERKLGNCVRCPLIRLSGHVCPFLDIVIRAEKLALPIKIRDPGTPLRP
jgi:hypothetical protein